MTLMSNSSKAKKKKSCLLVTSSDKNRVGRSGFLFLFYFFFSKNLHVLNLPTNVFFHKNILKTLGSGGKKG